MTFLTFWIGYLVGALSMGAAVLFGQRLRASQPEPDPAPPVDWPEFFVNEARDDALRQRNDAMVLANRMASESPHRLQILRAEHDRRQQGNGGQTW